MESTDQIASLHRAFSKGLKRSKGSDILSSERHTFFTEFVSPDGGRLSDVQIHRLVSFTKFWELGEDSVNDLKIRSLLWTARPELFWNGGVVASPQSSDQQPSLLSSASPPQDSVT